MSNKDGSWASAIKKGFDPLLNPSKTKGGQKFNRSQAAFALARNRTLEGGEHDKWLEGFAAKDKEMSASDKIIAVQSRLEELGKSITDLEERAAADGLTRGEQELLATLQEEQENIQAKLDELNGKINAIDPDDPDAKKAQQEVASEAETLEAEVAEVGQEVEKAEEQVDQINAEQDQEASQDFQNENPVEAGASASERAIIAAARLEGLSSEEAKNVIEGMKEFKKGRLASAVKRLSKAKEAAITFVAGLFLTPAVAAALKRALDIARKFKKVGQAGAVAIAAIVFLLVFFLINAMNVTSYFKEHPTDLVKPAAEIAAASVTSETCQQTPSFYLEWAKYSAAKGTQAIDPTGLAKKIYDPESPDFSPVLAIQCIRDLNSCDRIYESIKDAEAKKSWAIICPLNTED